MTYHSQRPQCPSLSPFNRKKKATHRYTTVYMENETSRIKINTPRQKFELFYLS